jgi:Flp pilus assembly pilin Flp
MQNKFLKLYAGAQALKNALKSEDAQDLVEYAAVIMIVVLGLTAGMHTLATGINTAMSSVVTQITTALNTTG